MTGNEFKTWRGRLGLQSQKDAAYHFGVSPDTIRSWEAGRRRIPQYAVRMIRVTLDYQLAVGKQ